MGDCRYTFKAEFQMGDIKESINGYYNYTKSGEPDLRILEFIEKCFQKGYRFHMRQYYEEK